MVQQRRRVRCVERTSLISSHMDNRIRRHVTVEKFKTHDWFGTLDVKGTRF